MKSSYKNNHQFFVEDASRGCTRMDSAAGIWQAAFFLDSGSERYASWLEITGSASGSAVISSIIFSTKTSILFCTGSCFWNIKRDEHLSEIPGFSQRQNCVIFQHGHNHSSGTNKVSRVYDPQSHSFSYKRDHLLKVTLNTTTVIQKDAMSLKQQTTCDVSMWELDYRGGLKKPYHLRKLKGQTR